MISQSKTFIEVPVIEGARTTKPVDETKRLAASEIKISIADETDAYRLAEGIYACFTQESIDKMEPPHLQPPMPTRLYLMARRIQPTLSQPHMHWIKATHLPTNTIIGAAAWASPSLPVHNIFRKSAFTFYNWKNNLNLTDADIDALYANVDDEVWSGTHAKNDEIRKEVVPEPHWYLASLITWPERYGDMDTA
ncbi:hypothetical protein E8E13_009805 [Curvularia kusanoi]|uniref:Uncharacterized protein n=1 Tax=Curvularia kusanoi TaxID=90978 RepID=A0A9P4TGG2_CURKU|nr:hypothetical protein E8E13_009805 [Curvularia kusanoi]